MFHLDVMSRMPVYEQIIDELERFILTGVIKPRDQLPSVRGLSVELSINPNTILKAYNELDSRKIIFERTAVDKGADCTAGLSRR